MNINRHNYEEFFLLYIDNELSQPQREAVENFVAIHTDLKAELELLQQLTLTPDAINFDAKADLLKQETGHINLANCQSYFLSYIDDELSVADRNATEKFVLQHPDVQPAFDSLKRAVLPNEAIVCPDKESLYKKETKVAPIFWFRMMAAAVVIGLGIMVWIVVPGDKPSNTGVELAYQNNPAVNNQTPTADVNATDEPIVSEEPTVTTTDAPIADGKMPIYNAVQTSASNTTTAKNNLTTISPAVVIDIPVTNQPKTIAPEKKTDIVTIPKPDKADKIERTENTNLYTAVSNETNTTSAIQPAIYKALDTEDEDNNVVYIGAAQISKQKLRGLFKTVTKMFEKPGKNKSNNTDDNSVDTDKK